MNLLRNPISALYFSPYASAAPVLEASSGRSRRLLHTFSAKRQPADARC